MQIGMIGAGNMSESMMTAWLRAGIVKPEGVVLADIRDDRLEFLKRRYGIRLAAHNRDVPSAAKTALVLGVKPQQLASVMQDLRTATAPQGPVISIAAGKRLDWLETQWPAARLVRVMPNIACRTGRAMSVFCLGSKATEEDRQTVRELLGALGRVMELPEATMDVVTAVSGSGPAFFARMARAMASAAAVDGLTGEQALLLAAQTMRGAASLLLDGEMSPDDLIAAVSSKSGVTVAGLEIMDRGGFDRIVGETINAAVRRSRELADTASV